MTHIHVANVGRATGEERGAHAQPRPRWLGESVPESAWREADCCGLRTCWAHSKQFPMRIPAACSFASPQCVHCGILRNQVRGSRAGFSGCWLPNWDAGMRSWCPIPISRGSVHSGRSRPSRAQGTSSLLHIQDRQDQAVSQSCPGRARDMGGPCGGLVCSPEVLPGLGLGGCQLDTLRTHRLLLRTGSRGRRWNAIHLLT